MRSAINRARRRDEFKHQQEFDKAIARLVRSTPVSNEIAEWFANEKLAAGERRSWWKSVFHPAIVAIVIALAVIGAIAWLKFDEQMHSFPGASTARKLLAEASVARSSPLEPVKTGAGAVGDFLLLKHQLSHCDVPPEFSHTETTGARVFEDDEAGRVAQVAVQEHRMQFYFFGAPRKARNGQPEEFSGWRFLEQDGWAGAVHEQDGVCFMAVLRGTKKDFAPYVPAQAAR